MRKKIEESPFDNFQNFARFLLLTGEIKVVDYSELHKLNSEINRIGNNINQVVHLAHLFDEISSEDIENLSQELETIHALVEQTLNHEIKKERRWC